MSEGQSESENRKESDESEVRRIHPFKIIQRGDDSVDKDGVVQFADFSPKVLPSEVVTEEADPKDESALAPVYSKELPVLTEQSTSDTTAPEPADKEDGESKTSDDGKQTSSSDLKSG